MGYMTSPHLSHDLVNYVVCALRFQLTSVYNSLTGHVVHRYITLPLYPHLWHYYGYTID